MKKVFIILLAASIFFISVTGCSSSNVINDLSETTGIEIRVHSMTDQAYEDYVITETETVRSICEMFSALKMKKASNDKPSMGLYELKFFKGGNNRSSVIEYVTVLFPGDAVLYNGNEYRITSEISLIDCLNNAIAACVND